MGARSGNNYLSAIKKFGAEVWVGGERAQVITHPAFANCARSIASLYDMQMERPEAMTFRTVDGGRAGMSFLQPGSVDEVHKRGRMMKAWADYGCGFLTYAPDASNVVVAAMAAAHGFFAESNPRCGDNIQNYYREARNHDWCAAQALIDPVPGERALRLVEQTSGGIVVSGCRMLATLAPVSEELLVLPASALKDDAGAVAFALSFAVPTNSKGLKFICRDPYDSNRSRFDCPLSSRFDEIDCAAIFENVFVPWERVFLCGDVARCNALRAATGALAHSMHQAVVRKLAKAEFLLGLAALIAETGGSIDRQHLAEMAAAAETIRGCGSAAESDAAADQWGGFAPVQAQLESACAVFSDLHQRLTQIIRTSGASLIVMPSEADFANAEERPALDRYFAVAGVDARDRVALYRLAWDATGSSFAGRQMLYERAFSSRPPVPTEASGAADLNPLIERVRAFLGRFD